MAPTLKLETYRDDAVELIELLRARYGQRKIFLLGHSWGSAVGLSVAVKRPDLLYAYIDTVGQQLVGRLAGVRSARTLRLEPRVDVALAEAPLPSHPHSGNLPRFDETVDRPKVDLEILQDFLGGQESFFHWSLSVLYQTLVMSPPAIRS